MKKAVAAARYNAGFAVLALAQVGVSMGLSTVLGALTGRVSTAGLAPGVLALAAGSAGLYALAAAGDYAFARLKAAAGNDTRRAAETALVDKVARLPADDPALADIGGLLTSARQDVDQAVHHRAEALPETILQGVQCLLVMGYLAVLSWRITLAYLAAVGVSVGLQAALSRCVNGANEAVKRSEVALNTQLRDLLDNRLTVKLNDAETFGAAGALAAGDACAAARVRAALTGLPVKMLGLLCGLLPMFALCLTGLLLLPRGLALSAFLTAYYLAEDLLVNQLHYIDLLLDLGSTRPARRRLQALLARPNAPDPAPAPDGRVLLDHAAYRYPGAENWAVQDLCLELHPGEKAVFFGPSGSGKSTALQLIAGLLAPARGRVQAGESLYVAQFPYLFDGPLQDNLTAFAPDPDPARLRAACRAAMLDPAALPDPGAPLHHNAANLSGGQRQRASLARALYRGAPVLLLDEATSALDAGMAREVWRRVCAAAPNATVILVTHSPDLAEGADRAFRFEGGRMQEVPAAPAGKGGGRHDRS